MLDACQLKAMQGISWTALHRAGASAAETWSHEPRLSFPLDKDGLGELPRCGSSHHQLSLSAKLRSIGGHSHIEVNTLELSVELRDGGDLDSLHMLGSRIFKPYTACIELVSELTPDKQSLMIGR